MGSSFWIEVVISILFISSVSFWLFGEYILGLYRDLNKITLRQQANVGPVRKQNETAHYRNFLVPNGFPLITGLSLSIGYKIRNGNFADIWMAIMELSQNSNNKITISNKNYTLAQINGMARHVAMNPIFNDVGNVGINVSCMELPGFIISLACMLRPFLVDDKNENLCPHILMSLNHEIISKVDVLVVDSNSTISTEIKNSKIKMIVCKDQKNVEGHKDISEFITWNQLIEGYIEDPIFKYTPPEDNSDDLKPFINITSKENYTTSFNQLNLVSSVSSFIKSFPMDHEITDRDSLAIVNTENNKTKNDALSFNVQIWTKLLSVLLHGGSIILANNEKEGGIMNIIKEATLLFITSANFKNLIQLSSSKYNNDGLWQRIRLSWSLTLLSEGIFTKWSQLTDFENLRCIYVVESLSRTDQISGFTNNITRFSPGQISKPLGSKTLNEARSLLGTRVVTELYCHNLVMGPISHSNFFDYRVLPENTEVKVVCLGALSTSLEGKFLETEKNPQFDITKRQGMLCIRGFTIGKPTEDERIKRAKNLSEEIAYGEGWMPLVGVYGLWGQDGCLYLFK